MKFVMYGSGTDKNIRYREDPWIPGHVFRSNPELEPLLRALEESGIETAEELVGRLNHTRFDVPGGYIEVTKDPDGRVNIRGVDQGITHHAGLVIQPEVSNSVCVSLTPAVVPAPTPRLTWENH